MKAKPLAAGLALGIMGIIYMIVVTYYPTLSTLVLGETKGEVLRAIMEDVYPYYDHMTWYAPILGGVYGFIDAFFFGLIFAGLYNLGVCEKKPAPVAKVAAKPAVKAAPKAVKKAVKKTATKKKAAPKKAAPKKKKAAKKRVTKKK